MYLKGVQQILSLSLIVKSMKNKAKEEMDFQEVMTKDLIFLPYFNKLSSRSK